MKKILLYPGPLSTAKDFSELFLNLRESNQYKTTLLSSKIFPESYCSGFENIVFDDKISSENDYFNNVDLNDIDISFVNEILRDPNIQLLWTRFNLKSQYWRLNPIERNNLNYSLIISALKVINNYVFDEILFLVLPHNLPIYIFWKVCEASNVPMRYFASSPLPWRFYVRSKNKIEINRSLKDKPFLDDISKFVEEQKEMIVLPAKFPNYKFKNNLHKLFFKSLIDLKANYYNVYSFLKQKECQNQYKKLVSARNIFCKSRFAVFYLHFQPEESTLPTGKIFSQQLIAIQYLINAIKPLGINLVVREHPMTFKHHFNPTWRSKNFYSAIKNIDKDIIFDDINSDRKSLLVNSVMSASITGTILVESNIIGIPTVCFGNHNLQYLKEDYIVDKFKDAADLRNQISKALSLKKDEIQKSMHNNLNQLFERTFGSYDFKGSKHFNVDEYRMCKYMAINEYLGFDNR